MPWKSSLFQNFLASHQLVNFAANGPGMCLNFRYCSKDLSKREKIAIPTNNTGIGMEIALEGIPAMLKIVPAK